MRSDTQSPWAASTWFTQRALPAAIAAAVLGFATAWLRQSTGVFVIGLQGMLIGALLGTVNGRLARRDRFSFGLMLSAALLSTGVYTLAHFLGGDVLRAGPFELGGWASDMAGGDTRELALGWSRPSLNMRRFTGGSGFVLFAIVDAALQWLLTVALHRVALPAGGNCSRCGFLLEPAAKVCPDCSLPVDFADGVAIPPMPKRLPRPGAAITVALLVPVACWATYLGAIASTSVSREAADREARRRDWFEPSVTKEPFEDSDTPTTRRWKEANNAMVDAWLRFKAAPDAQKEPLREAWLAATRVATEAQEAQLAELQEKLKATP